MFISILICLQSTVLHETDFVNTERAYLLLGSNIGNREAYLLSASELLEAGPTKMLRKSQLYLSQAWGETEQPAFYNQCIAVETALNPFELLKLCKEVEQKVGRTTRKKWMEREIDIDILFFGEKNIKTHYLSIPHPQMIRRKFALLPMSEIAPDWIHKEYGLTITDLLNLCTDDLNVEILKPE